MPRWKELKRFCEHDGWVLYKDTNHYYYYKLDNDGTSRRTMVSKGSGKINGSLWKEILNHQLKVTKEYFNKMI